jgi:glutaredoxin
MHFKIYSKLHCPYCVRAKRLLEAEGDSYEELLVGEDISREELLELIPNARTVPQIFLESDTGSKYIGGYTELAAWHQGGRNGL